MTVQLKEKFLKAFKQQYGVIGPACEAIGISRTTYSEWCRKDAKFSRTIDELKENAIDKVVTKSYKMMLEGEGNTTLIIFYLKTKARHLGYREVHEIEHKGLDNKKLQETLAKQAVKYERDY